MNDEFNRGAKVFENAGFQLCFAPKDGLKVLDFIEEEQPDLVLMDLFIAAFRRNRCHRSLQRLKTNKNRYFCKSSFQQSTLERTTRSNVSYFTVEPFHAQDLADRMLQLTGYQNKIEDKLEENNVNHLPSLEIPVTEISHQIGVPAHIKGYRYLRDSIIMAIET